MRKQNSRFRLPLYAIFWLVPLINWFILWSTVSDVRNLQKGEKISQWGTFFEIWFAYILMGFDLGFLLVIFLTLLLGILNIPAVFSEILFFALPLLIPIFASVWFLKETKKIRLIIGRV
jgi:drug/metabolite transporter (DMT)-like permease